MRALSTSRVVARSLRQLTFSRHAAMSALIRGQRRQPVTSLTRRLAGLVFGSGLIGVAVALLVQADLGLAPYDVFSSAVSDRLGLSLGQAGWLVAGGLFGAASLLGRRPSGWGLTYIVANGFAIDAASGLLTQPDTVFGRWTFVAAAIVLMASGVSLVLFSGTTGGPFELLMRAGEDRGVNPIAVRYGLDLGVFLTGVLLAGRFGPATLVYGISFGLVMRAVGQALADHEAGRRARLAQESASDEGASAGDGFGAGGSDGDARQVAAQPHRGQDEPCLASRR